MNTGNGSEAKKKRNRRVRNKDSTPKSARTVGDFWGDPAKLPPVSEVVFTTDSSAVVRSLGRFPVTGYEAISEHYFRAVYDHAVNLAAVLVAAGDLLDATDAD